MSVILIAENDVRIQCGQHHTFQTTTFSSGGIAAIAVVSILIIAALVFGVAFLCLRYGSSPLRALICIENSCSLNYHRFRIQAHQNDPSFKCPECLVLSREFDSPDLGLSSLGVRQSC